MVSHMYPNGNSFRPRAQAKNTGALLDPSVSLTPHSLHQQVLLVLPSTFTLNQTVSPVLHHYWPTWGHHQLLPPQAKSPLACLPGPALPSSHGLLSVWQPEWAF